MRRAIAFGLGAIAIVTVYVVVLVSALGVAAALLVPIWAAGILPRTAASLVPLMLFDNAVAVVVASVPFAWLIARVFGRSRLYVAVSVAVVAWTWIELPFASSLGAGRGSFPRVAWATDSIETLVALPALVWILYRLSSNYRLERPR